MKTIYKRILIAIISIILVSLFQGSLDIINENSIYITDPLIQNGFKFMYVLSVIGMAFVMIGGFYLVFTNHYWEKVAKKETSLVLRNLAEINEATIKIEYLMDGKTKPKRPGVAARRLEIAVILEELVTKIK